VLKEFKNKLETQNRINRIILKLEGLIARFEDLTRLQNCF
jgi:hypothetical protein